MNAWSWKQRLPIGIVIFLGGIWPLFFYQSAIVWQRISVVFALLFGLIGSVLFVLQGLPGLLTGLGYTLGITLILVGRVPELSGSLVLLCLAAGSALLFCTGRMIKRKKALSCKNQRNKSSYKIHRGNMPQRQRKGNHPLSPQTEKIRETMGWLQASALLLSIISFSLAIVKKHLIAWPAMLLSLGSIGIWGLCFLMIAPEISLRSPKQRYLKKPLKMDPSLQLMIPFLLSLLLATNSSAHTVYDLRMLWVCLIPGIVAGTLTYVRYLGKNRAGTALLALLMTAAIVFPSYTLANFSLPFQEKRIETHIIRKYKTGGKTTSYYWVCGEGENEIRLNVSLNRYNEKEPGDAVTVAERHGSLGLTWYLTVADPQK